MDAALRRILDEHLALRVDLPVAISSPRSLAGVSRRASSDRLRLHATRFGLSGEAPLQATTPSRYTGPKSSVMLLLATIREQQRLRQP